MVWYGMVSYALFLLLSSVQLNDEAFKEKGKDMSLHNEDRIELIMAVALFEIL